MLKKNTPESTYTHISHSLQIQIQKEQVISLRFSVTGTLEEDICELCFPFFLKCSSVSKSDWPSLRNLYHSSSLKAAESRLFLQSHVQEEKPKDFACSHKTFVTLKRLVCSIVGVKQCHTMPSFQNYFKILE